MLANPPFGVEWKPEADHIRREHEEQVFGGRFGAGLPRINDGSLLFLQHMISKMKSPENGGTRLAIVFNGSPLFTGSAGSGESDIRRWIIENDWLEAIVALPDQLFYNTGIYTYLWIVTNRKAAGRKGKVQLVNATSFFKKMRKSLGNKRNEISAEQRDTITRLYGALTEGEHVRVFDNTDFGYRRITVERPLRLNFTVDEDRLERLKQTPAFQKLATSKKRKDTKAAQAEIEEGLKLQKPVLSTLDGLASKDVFKNRNEFADLMKACFKDAGLKIPTALTKAILGALSERDETADVCLDSKGNPEPDPELRGYENVPLKEDLPVYIQREVLPHVPDAYVDESKTKIGYEINFNRYFYKYQPPRPLDEIEGDLKKIEAEIAEMLTEVTEKEQTEEAAEHTDTRDSLDISAQLDDLRLMKNGWLEGEGLVPPHEGLDWLSQAFTDHYPGNLPRPYLYPTEEGGVQAEWSLGPKEVSLEIELSSHSGEWHVLDMETNDVSERTLNIEDADDWKWLVEQIQQMNQDEE